jgi:hypothetical protein
MFDGRRLRGTWPGDPLARGGGRLREPDDTFVYVPTMRKVRRASGWVDGLGPATACRRLRRRRDPIGGSLVPGGSASPTAGESIR